MSQEYTLVNAQGELWRHKQLLATHEVITQSNLKNVHELKKELKSTKDELSRLLKKNAEDHQMFHEAILALKKDIKCMIRKPRCKQ